MPASSLPDILGRLRTADSFLITSHVHPDGDAVGSLLGVAHLLRAWGKTNITCALQDPVPRLYRWLPGALDVVTPAQVPASVDVALVIDVARRERIGSVADCIPRGAEVLVLDHHLEVNPDGDYHFVDPSYAAAGEIVVESFETTATLISPEAAVCMYVAIITDTGGFRFSNTNPRSHRLTARLLETGIDVAALSARCFDIMSVPKYKLLRHVLDEVQFNNEGRVAYAEVTAQAMEALNAGGEDLDGLINFIRNIEGVEVAVLLRQIGNGATKVSLRSRPGFNAAAVLHDLGGGGHAAAAGATLEMPLGEARKAVLVRVEQTLRGAV